MHDKNSRLTQAVMSELDGLKKNKLVCPLAREAARLLEQIQGEKMLQLQVSQVVVVVGEKMLHLQVSQVVV